jgi:hypothetical protein
MIVKRTPGILAVSVAVLVSACADESNIGFLKPGQGVRRLDLR